MAVLGLAVVGLDVGLLAASTGAGELEAGVVAELGAAVSFSGLFDGESVTRLAVVGSDVAAEMGAAVSFSGLFDGESVTGLSDVGAAVYNLYLLGFERFL